MYCQHSPSQSSSITVNVVSSAELGHVDFEIAEDFRRVDHRRDRPFLVPCPAAPHFAVGHFAFVRIVLPLVAIADADRIHVGIDRDQLLAFARLADLA